MSEKLIIAVFASHSGTDLQSIIDATQTSDYPAEIAVVFSNNKKSYALERARKANIPTNLWQRKNFESDEDYTEFAFQKLVELKVDLICLAGYMKLIPAKIVGKFKILNIHPALLPKYGGQGMYGLHVHQAVISAGEKITGVTVHEVNEVYDDGRILAQEEVPVLANDTPEILQKRVLIIEHKFYPATIAKIARGEIKLNE